MPVNALANFVDTSGTLPDWVSWGKLGPALENQRMAGVIEARLAELGVELPAAAAPAANYVPYVVSGKLIMVAGQVPFWNGELKGVG